LRDAVAWTNGKAEILSRSLPDAIVAEGLDDAFRAFRIEPTLAFVTLGGEVLEPPGVLRLGPGGPSEGLLTTRREIREIRETLARSTEELERLGRRYEQVRSDLAARETRASSLAEQMHSLEKQLVGLEHQKQQLDEEESRAGRKGQVLTSERSRAESERESLRSKREEMGSSLVVEEEAKEKVEEDLGRLRIRLSERRTEQDVLQGRAADDASHVAALRERANAVRVDVERLREGVGELESRISASRREKLELAERGSALRNDLAEAEVKVASLLGERDELSQSLTVLEEGASRLRSRGEMTEAALKLRRTELESVREARSSEEIAVTREELEMDHLRKGFESAHGISLADAAALLRPTELDRDDGDLENELDELKRKLDTIGPVNPMADEEYRELETRFEFLTSQRKDLLDSISSTESAIRRIDSTSQQRFEEAFEQINRYFDLTFKQLFGGGRAGLRLIDEEDLLESGVDIIAQPPGKMLQNVLLLSGGEKALTAIALMFAIFRYKPSPFCLLDEVDAPLDDANVGRFLAMLDELRKTTQFIIITHNRKTMGIADQMYGVTMAEPGISKLVSVNFVEAEAGQTVETPA
jgi:chromosome segregation protein